MTDELNQYDREALISYRLSRSLETLGEAKYNADGGYYNTAVNRLYYAAYYAATALLLAYGHSASTHAGVKTLLALYFIKPGKLSMEHGKTFMLLFENRQLGDYEDFVYCDLELFNSLLPKTDAFIEVIKKQINNK